MYRQGLVADDFTPLFSVCHRYHRLVYADIWL